MTSEPVIALMQQLVSIPSVTALLPENYHFSEQTLDLLEEQAVNSGAKTWRLPAEGGHIKWPYKVDNLYAEWTFGTPKRRLVFMGHTDVVPPGPHELWSFSPFSAIEKDGFIYGRGTTDMKGAIAAFFSAVAASPDLKDIAIGALITTDEEWAAINGSRHVLSWMKQEHKFPDSLIIGEPSSRDSLGTHIKLGRRGSLVGRLIAKGVQGHAAYPKAFVNPNRALTLALSILQSLVWDDSYPAMPATNFEPIALNSGDFNASAIVPDESQSLWNIRFTPKQTPEDLVKQLQHALEHPPQWALSHPNINDLKNIEIIGNIDTASLPYVSEAGQLAECTLTAIKTITGKTAIPDCSGGTTDGRFVPLFFPTAEIIEVGPPERGGLLSDGTQPDDYLSRGGMHQIDERIAIKDLIDLQNIYAEILLQYTRFFSNPATGQTI